MRALMRRSDETLLDELENLRIENVVRSRLQDFDKSQVISHENMMKKFEFQDY